MNGFEQIKSFYSWVFNNPDKIRPTHISLYLFLWNQGNRANWVEWFKCPYDLAMQGACIGNKGTYYRCLDDLKTFGLIDYKKGINNFKAPQIHLFQLYKSEQLTEQVTVPLSEPQTVPLSVPQYAPQYAPQYVPIYKHITNNIKLITDNEKEFYSVISNLGKSKNIKKENRCFSPPTFDEVKIYFIENGYNNSDKFFKGYSVADWKDSNGKQIINWKQKAQQVWFKEENKIKNPSTKLEFPK